MHSRLSACVALALQCATARAWGYCSDTDASCAKWANNDECEGSNAAVVKGQCPHSCSVCSHICRDFEPGCPEWAANGKQCQDNPEYMNKNCPTSCGICKPTRCTMVRAKPPLACPWRP